MDFVNHLTIETKLRDVNGIQLQNVEIIRGGIFYIVSKYNNERDKNQKPKKKSVNLPKNQKKMLVFTVICTLLKMKEQNNNYLDYFNDNEMFEVSMKIFNANCVDYGT